MDGRFQSEPATIFLIPDHRRVEFSEFTLDAEDWRIIGNGPKEYALPLGGLRHQRISRGLLNFYVFGTDQITFSDRDSNSDRIVCAFNNNSTPEGRN